MFDTAYEFIWIRFASDNISKLPGFTEFCKNIKVVSSENSNTLNYDFYNTLYKGGIITKDEFTKYVENEKLKSVNPKVEPTDNGYTLYFNKRTIYIEEIIKSSAKLYFGINDDVWDKVEPLFYAILERNLGMDEDVIYNCIGFLYDVETIPFYVAEDITNRLASLDEFKNIKSIKDVIGVDVFSKDEKTASKILVNFLLQLIEKIRKSKDSKELKRNISMFKAVIGIENK